MTIETSASSQTFPGNGVAVVFPCSFRIFDDTDVNVSLVNPTTGSATPLTLNSDYTISGAGDQNGFTLSTTVPVASGVNLYVKRDIGYTQPTDFTNQGSFFPTMHEDMADRLEMQIQQLLDISERSMTIPGGLVPSPSAVLPFPSPGSLLGWSADGLSIVNLGASGVGAGSIADVNVASNAGIQSSKLSFLQVGTGAVLRSLQSKEAERVSLNDFGATGFTAMLAAVNAVKAAGGGSVKMPNGTQNTPVPGNYWGGVLQSGDIGGVVLEYDGPNVPVSMFFEQYGTNYISQKVFRFYDNQAHTGFGHSAVHIENVAYGTGNIGPTNADFGLSISLKKLNTNTGTARAGELDGIYIGVRNDGSNSDTTALLLDVANYGVGFNCAFEANITYFFSGVANLAMDVQCGVIDSRTNNQYGLVLAAQNGTLGYGILLQSLAGANWTNFIVGAFNQINTYLVKSNGRTYLTTLDGTKNVSHGIDPSTGAYFVNIASDSLRIFTLDQSGNLSLGGYVNVGGTNIIGASASTATAGSAALPANPVGFMTISRSGTTYKIPYYNN